MEIFIDDSGRLVIRLDEANGNQLRSALLLAANEFPGNTAIRLFVELLYSEVQLATLGPRRRGAPPSAERHAWDELGRGSGQPF